jgi:hypothetical protein
VSPHTQRAIPGSDPSYVLAPSRVSDRARVSLLYQARDVKAAREQASRTFHHELLKMEMESPFYMDAMAVPWGLTVGLADYDSLRRNNFVHMWVSYWEGQYMLGELPDSEIRYSAASELFVSARWASILVANQKC